MKGREHFSFAFAKVREGLAISQDCHHSPRTPQMRKARCFTSCVLLVLAAAFMSTLNAEESRDGAVDTAQAIRSAQQVVVKLFGAGAGTLDSYGSGVLVSETGHVVTVWNHLVNSGYLNAVVFDGRRYQVKVVGTSLQHDLAVLKLDCEDDETFPFVDWKTRTKLTVGDSVLAFSNVYHVATGNEPVSVVHSVVACETPLQAGFGRWQFPVKSPVYVLDAVTNNSGAAGGLLTKIDGQPAGLLGRELRHKETGMWVNYAVPWDVLNSAVGKLMSGRRVSPSATDTADRKSVSERRLTAEFGLTLLPEILKKTPAFVDRVIPNSPANTAGLLRGDLILMVNDQVIQSADDLRAAVATFRKGQSISLTVNRNERLETLTLRAP